MIFWGASSWIKTWVIKGNVGPPQSKLRQPLFLLSFFVLLFLVSSTINLRLRWTPAQSIMLWFKINFGLQSSISKSCPFFQIQGQILACYSKKCHLHKCYNCPKALSFMAFKTENVSKRPLFLFRSTKEIPFNLRR